MVHVDSYVRIKVTAVLTVKRTLRDSLHPHLLFKRSNLQLLKHVFTADFVANQELELHALGKLLTINALAVQ